MRTKSQDEFLHEFHSRVLCMHGIPTQVYSDMGSEFRNTGLNDLCAAYKINQKFTSGYSPSQNGFAERQVQNVVNCLRASINEAGTGWADLLPQITFNLNNSICRATGFSPYYLVHGRIPKTLALQYDLEIKHDNGDTVFSKWVKDQTLTQQVAFDNANDFEDITRQAVNANRAPIKPVQVGDMAYMFQPPHKETDNLKLEATFIGPFVITDVLERGNVLLKNAKTLKTHPYPVHLSRLKLARNMKDD